MKVTKKFLEARYDNLYERAEKLFMVKYRNPCELGGLNCASLAGPGYCCYGCKYLGKNGCRVKSLGCKLYYCAYILTKYPGLVKELRMIEREAQFYRISCIRGGKAYSIEYALRMHKKFPRHELYKEKTC